MFLTGITSFIVVPHFPLSITFFAFMQFLILFHLYDTISFHEVLSINPSAKMFVFEDLSIHYKSCLTYSGRTDRPGELCYNFAISNDLTQMLNCPPCIPDYDSRIPALLDLFISIDANVFLLWLSLHWEIPILFLSQHSLWLFLC